MPSLEWMRQEFDYGYSSGNVLADPPDPHRLKEEAMIGGSYRRVFLDIVAPLLRPDMTVLELGPGGGSWTRALLEHLPEGRLHTVDFQDIGRWIDIPSYNGRLVHHQVQDNEFTSVSDGSFDFFFTWGVICHWAQGDIEHILRRVKPKMKPGAQAVLNYAAWEKLDRYGWERGGVPVSFQSLPDEEMWWPRNSVAEMSDLCRRAGWTVLAADLNAVERDGVIHLRAD